MIRDASLLPRTKIGKPKHDFTSFKNNLLLYTLLLPAMLYVFVYSYMTLPYIYLAFTHLNLRAGLFHGQFVALKNFEFFFKSQAAWTVSWNTIKFNLINIAGGTLLALALAVFFNEVKSVFFKRVNQSIMIFPFFISWASVNFFVYNFFAYDNGLVNSVLKLFNVNAVAWYSDPAPWTWIISGVNLWKGVGLSAVVYLAAISGIDQEMYEAATIDGANRWQKMLKITIPSLIPTICILFLLGIGRIFYGDFGMMYALIGDNGVLFPTTDIIDTYVFRALRKTGDPSSAMAISLFQSLVGLVTVLASNYVVKRLNPEAAIF